MKKIALFICLFLKLAYSNTDSFLGPLPIDDRVGYEGGFDCFVSGNGNYSDYMGGLLFESVEYSLTFIISEEKKPSALTSIPQPLLPIKTNIGKRYDESGAWRSRREGPFDFLYLESDSDYTYKERLGMLVHPRKLFLYDGNYLLFASDEGLRWSGYNPRVTAVRSSSALIEGKRRYSGANSVLFTSEEYLPWVEGVEGNGIGEWFEIETESEAWSVDFLLVSNGYVDFTRPNLYTQNGRVRRMRIEIPEHSLIFEVELADTPRFQEVRLPMSIDDGETVIRLTVLDVYPGSRWEDTCLNLVIPMGDRPD